LLIAPYVELLFPVQIESVFSLSGTNLPFGKDKSGNSITLNLTQTIANVAIESVDVPAGTMADAMHQTTKIAGTAFDGGQSTPAVLCMRAETYAAIAIRVHDPGEKLFTIAWNTHKNRRAFMALHKGLRLVCTVEHIRIA
jgi:hypothetical protein